MTPSPEESLTVETTDPKLAAMLQQEVEMGANALGHGNPDMAIGFFRSALSKIGPDFPFYGHITHNLLLAYKNRIEQLFLSGRGDESGFLGDEAITLEIRGSFAGEPAFRRNFADAMHGLGLVFFQNIDFASCIRFTRKAIAIEPCPTYSLNLINAQAVLKGRPRLSDFTTRITPDQLGRHVFIACVPKSASTFLKNVLVSLSGYKDLFPTFSSWQADQEIYLPSLVEYAEVNTVTQQHCRASEANIQTMQAFGIRPVVLMRNIFDAIVSMADFYRQGAYFNSYFRGDFLELDPETQVDLLIDNIVPWYLQFVASWELAEKEERLEIYWLKYEDLIADEAETVKQVLEFYGLGAKRSGVEGAIAAEKTEARKNRFNIGIAGRGKALTEAQKMRIISFKRYYPSTDFSRIGI